MATTSPQAEPAYRLILQARDLLLQNTNESCRQAVEVAKEAVRVAPAGSYELAVANAYVAGYSAYFHLAPDAETYAQAFEALLPAHPKARKYKPYVAISLAIAYRRTRRAAQACNLLREALADAEGEIAERLRVCLVWALCEAGRPDEAGAELPEAVYHLPDAFRRAAYARLLFARGEWEAAWEEARSAWAGLAAAPLYDSDDAWFLCHISKRSAEKAAEWAESLASIPTLWDGVMSRPALTPREQETLDALKAYIAEHGWAPTIDELRAEMRLHSKSWPHQILLNLQEKGYIHLGKGSRTIRINPPA